MRPKQAALTAQATEKRVSDEPRKAAVGCVQAWHTVSRERPQPAAHGGPGGRAAAEGTQEPDAPALRLGVGALHSQVNGGCSHRRVWEPRQGGCGCEHWERGSSA